MYSARMFAEIHRAIFLGQQSFGTGLNCDRSLGKTNQNDRSTIRDLSFGYSAANFSSIKVGCFEKASRVGSKSAIDAG